jgi:hypothetical protein
MDTAMKLLGAPIPGEDQDTTVTCPVCGHGYGLYGYGVRNDFCARCERTKAKGGDREAQKRLWRHSDLYQKAKRESQHAESRAQQRGDAARPRGARWEPWEECSAKGF